MSRFEISRVGGIYIKSVTKHIKHQKNGLTMRKIAVTLFFKKCHKKLFTSKNPVFKPFFCDAFFLKSVTNSIKSVTKQDL